jgi:hypothetical protein
MMGTSSFIGGGGGLAPSSAQALYSAGNLKVHFGLGYSFAYATGLLNQPGQHASVVSEWVSASLGLQLGPHWSLSYSPSLPSYSSGSGYSDVVGQSVSLTGTTIYQGWTLGLSEGYSFSDTPIVQTGAQTEEEAVTTALSASHSLGNDFTLAVGLDQSAVLASQFNDVYSYSGSVSVNYVLSPKVLIGADVGASYSPVSIGPSTTSESYQGVLMVHLGPRATVNLSGGIQESSYGAGGLPTETTPTFSASVLYLLGKKTTISVSASRSLSPTFFSNQVATSTSVGVSISRPLSQKLQVSVSGGYSDTSYQAIEPGPVTYYLVGNTSSPLATTAALEVAREDRSSSVGASLSYAFRTHLTASVSYGWSENSSSETAFTYTSSQVSFNLSYGF